MKKEFIDNDEYKLSDRFKEARKRQRRHRALLYLWIGIIIVVIVAVVAALIGFEIYVWNTYKDVPVGELPAWVLWFMWGR